jgi:glycosyltransferase involved in cell wall biosynthesis/exopolysaccharide biosynthesis predicted pyruvyltransferase EpsI
MTPKVSVIVPIYNVEKYLRQCLDSLIGQTLSDIEIICIDDYGDDDSMQIVYEFVAADSRVKIVCNDRNLGVSESRNNGIKNSSAPYIMFCDSDDYFEPTMCEKMLKAIQTSKADIALCGTNIIYETDFELQQSDAGYYKVKFDGLCTINDSIMYSTDVCAWNKIYKRDILSKYNVWFPKGLKYEDAYFFNAYFCWVKSVFFIDEKLYNYRRRVGSIMNETFSGTSDFAIDHLKIAISFYDYLQKYNLYIMRLEYFWNFFLNYFRLSLEKSNLLFDKRAIYDMAISFINKTNPPLNLLPIYMQRHITMIKNKTTHSVQKRALLFKLLSVKENFDRKIVRFLGIPIWKIKFFDNKKKYYLLGIRVRKKILKNQKVINLKLDAKNFHPFDINNQSLLSQLRTAHSFTYVPNSGNMGDILIAKATIDFFDANDIAYEMYDGKVGSTIVYGGGGIWVPYYKDYWIELIKIFNEAKKIIILPSSFWDCPEFVEALDSRFTIFCRDKKSYDYLVSCNTKAKIFLDHDMAFRMTKKALEGDIRIGREEELAIYKCDCFLRKIPRIAKFNRADIESVGNYDTDVDLSNLFWLGSISSKDWINFGAKLMLSAADSVDGIITDRLHVGIAGALMGKQVYMIDNTYKKISNVYKQSMSDLLNVHLSDAIPENIDAPHTATNNFKEIVKAIG